MQVSKLSADYFTVTQKNHLLWLIDEEEGESMAQTSKERSFQSHFPGIERKDVSHLTHCSF